MFASGDGNVGMRKVIAENLQREESVNLGERSTTAAGGLQNANTQRLAYIPGLLPS